MMNKKDEMHPDDLRNLFIFFILSMALYFVYDHFVAQPKAEALRRAQAARAELAAVQAPGGGMAAELKLRPRNEVLAESPRIEINNGSITGTIALKGGRIDDIELSKYFETLEKKKNVILLSPKNTELPRYIDYGWVADENSKVAVPGPDTVWQVQGNPKLTKDTPVVLVWDNGAGLLFTRRIEIDDKYVFKITQEVVNNSGQDVTLYPFSLISQTGIPKDFQGRWISHEGPIGYVGEELLEITYKALGKEPVQIRQAMNGWIGITEKYWLTALIPAQQQNVKYRFNYTPLPEDPKKGRYQVDFLGAPVEVAAGKTGVSASHLFAGAKEVYALEAYEEKLGLVNFDLAVDFGMFYFLTKYVFFYALHFFGTLTGNFGIAIVIMTLIIRTAVFPLTNTSYKSFAKMKMVAPQIAELRDKYGTDKAMLQKELMQMYEREGVNPMAGCFPILIQIPIFFAFYKVLFATIEMRHAPFFGWIQDLSAPDPTSVFNLFGLLPYDVPAFLQIGVWPCIMLVAMIFQKKLNPPPQDQLQKDMMNYFPFIITYTLAHFASGLVIYWTLSAILSIIQQTIIMRRLGVPIYLFDKNKIEADLEKKVEKGPAVHPLVEMVEEEVEEALFGEHGDKPKNIKPPKPKKKKKK
ncbi:MAG TPA: membrane protein insertase YidC [Rhodospirillaceae bacterium]|nr:membrane protein insertase YidC [Rhodospirillaceae bacterium]